MSESQKKYQDEELIVLHTQGLSDGKMAKILGVSRTSISERRKRLELPANFKPSDPRPHAAPPRRKTAKRRPAHKNKSAPHLDSGERLRKIRIMQDVWERVKSEQIAKLLAG